MTVQASHRGSDGSPVGGTALAGVGSGWSELADHDSADHDSVIKRMMKSLPKFGGRQDAPDAPGESWDT